MLIEVAGGSGGTRPLFLYVCFRMHDGNLKKQDNYLMQDSYREGGLQSEIGDVRQTRPV